MALFSLAASWSDPKTAVPKIERKRATGLEVLKEKCRLTEIIGTLYSGRNTPYHSKVYCATVIARELNAAKLITPF